MRYLVLGAGALGGYFGARLLKGGADVTFLVRPARATQLRRNGLVVRAQDGESRTQVKTVQSGQIDGPYDVVLLCCKAYDLDTAIEAIAPAVGDRSTVLPVLNGVRHIDTLANRFGEGRVLGGLTMINATLLTDGSIQQGPLKVNTTAIGELDGTPSERCAAIQHAFAAGGLPATVSDQITGMLWGKLFGFACIATIATLTRSRAGSIASLPGGSSFVASVIEECARIVTAVGFPPPADMVGVLPGMFSQPEFDLTARPCWSTLKKASRPKAHTRLAISWNARHDGTSRRQSWARPCAISRHTRSTVSQCCHDHRAHHGDKYRHRPRNGNHAWKGRAHSIRGHAQSG